LGHPSHPGASTQPRFRVAIVGCGRIADVHVDALRTIADAAVVACCDVDESAARAFATRHGIPTAHADVERMLKDCAPNAVHLLTPPASHRALVEACARQAAHVYVEKPLAPTEADARAIAAVARSSGIEVCPGHNRLFDPPFLELQRRVAAGDIGRVLSVRAEQGFGYEAVAHAARVPWSYAYDWGVYDNLMPHPLYLVCHFLANPGVPIVAGFDLGTVQEAAVEEIRVLIPSDAAIGEVVLSMNASPQRAKIEVVGTRGTLAADYVGLYVSGSRVTGMPAAVQRLTAGLHAARQHAAGSTALILGALTGRVRPYMGIRTLVREFYRALGDGQPAPVRLEAGLLNVRLMEQIRLALAGKEKLRVRVAGMPSAPARVLVTGATGFLGGRLVERLGADGVVTRATTRIASRARPISNVEWVRCNLASEEDLRRAMAGVKTVYHCAAMAGAPGSLEDYEQANVAGTLRVARIAEDVGVETLVYVSSISVYALPPRGVRYLDEGAPYDARAAERGFYTQSKLGADRAILEHARTHPALRIVVLRPGTLYGPGAPLPLGRLELPTPFRQRPLVAGGPGVPMPLSFVDNVIDAMLAADGSHAPSGSVFNVVDEPDCTQGTVAAAITEASRGRIQPRFVSYPVVWLLMLALDLIAWARRGIRGTARYRLRRTLADMRYPCRAARETLKWSPSVSLFEGLARVLATLDERPYPR
jgi:2-alkyl-3-oxoalkanoate reductase